MAPRTLLLGLSGPSSSGKTTLARLLRAVLAPHAFIIHEDDFYHSDSEIPVQTASDGRQLQDWDCAGAIDAAALRRMLAFVKEHGRVRDGFDSIQDGNEVHEVDVREGVVERWKTEFGEALGAQEMRICIVDGFLLFSEEMSGVRELFDVRMLLRADFATVKRRREARKGYVTLEGFWEDPEGYVDEIVWPNYVKDHGFLFKDGDVEGELDEHKVSELGIDVAPKESVNDMTLCFEWASKILRTAIVERSSGSDKA